MDSLNEFVLKSDPTNFEPYCSYDNQTDSAICYFEDTDSFGERIDELLTIYRSVEGKRLVGCKVKGVKRMLETLGSFNVSIKEDEVSLSVLCLAGLSRHIPEENRKIYELLNEEAVKLNLPAMHVV